MSPARRLLPVLVATGVLLVATGCSESAGPSQEQYVAAADGVCEEAKERIDALYMAQAVDVYNLASEGGETPVYVDRPERWVRAKVVPEYERLSGRLKGIQPPDGDGAYLTDLYSDLDERIAVLHNRPSDGRSVIETDEQLRDRFVSYGMEECPPPYEEHPDYENPEKIATAAREAEEAEEPEVIGE